MCPNLEVNKLDQIPKQSINDIDERITDTLYSHTSATHEVFLQTLVVNIKGKKTRRKARVILDTGSQRSYIKKSTAEELSLDGKYSCSLDALDQDIICNNIASVRYGPWMRELKRKKIFVTDFQNNSGPIEILLGADVVGKLFTGKREELMSGLVAMGTKLGWTLIGKAPQLQHQNMNMTVVSMLSQELSVSFLWDLELLGIRHPVEQNNKDDLRKAAMIHYEILFSKIQMEGTK
ncbi:uncharacterized protein TNCT_513871 [Trichonephila clavata]|uniref:Peptidase aspartic putative domain-containing protein n=1 Tax=Trichonephila clavata TaxID=2740835 RepID=A0A8X6EYT2_TRICU|nr:uncharacterized protein TNCT_513871 [Trichonephila clavata]